MRIFSNYLEAAKEIERDLFEIGANTSTKSMQDIVGDFPIKELIGYSFSVPSLSFDLKTLAEYMGLNPYIFTSYITAELGDRIDGVPNPGISWEVRSEEWKRYLHEGKFAYTYPERIWSPTNQFGHCYSVLKTDPQSRQAIIQIYDKHKDFTNTGGRARIPCSLTYQFIRRGSDTEPKLHCIYTMRSCDFYRHWGYDMVLACMMTSYLAGKLGWIPGNVIMQIGSFHAYLEDLDKRKIF